MKESSNLCTRILNANQTFPNEVGVPSKRLVPILNFPLPSIVKVKLLQSLNGSNYKKSLGNLQSGLENEMPSLVLACYSCEI